MSGSDELYPPAQYGWGWILLALGILALLILAAWIVIVLTRPKTRLELPSAQAHGPTRMEEVLAVLRGEYLQQIDRIEADYGAGRIDAKKANLELSRTVRAFANEYSGVEAPVLALDDLVAMGVHPALIDALHRHYYPSVFRRGPAMDPAAGIAAARTVVTAWN